MKEIKNVMVAVVGGAGFLGSHLVNYLVEKRDCQVIVLDNLITGLKRFIHPKAIFEYCDITGTETYLYRLFKKYQVDYVFNYAAEPYIPVSFERPIHVFDTNAFGAIKVINAAAEAGVEGILQVSSAEIYGDQKGSISEEAPVTPHSSYGASKAAIDFLVQARYRENKTPCIALRQFNCLGERETHPYVVPDIINQIWTQRFQTSPLTVRLGNNSTRDFLYAGDAVKIAVELLERGRFGEVYNLGSEEIVQVYDLAPMIGSIMGQPQINVVATQSRVRPWEIWHLQSDNTKIHGVIGERHLMSLQTSLTRTVDYFIDNGGWDW